MGFDAVVIHLELTMGCEMEIELIEAWVKMNAPESIKDDLIEGAKMLSQSRLNKKLRRDRYPNEGNEFTQAESHRIMQLEDELTGDPGLRVERELMIEKEFGRPLKSIRGRLRRMKAKAV